MNLGPKYGEVKFHKKNFFYNMSTLNKVGFLFYFPHKISPFPNLRDRSLEAISSKDLSIKLPKLINMYSRPLFNFY